MSAFTPGQKVQVYNGDKWYDAEVKRLVIYWCLVDGARPGYFDGERPWPENETRLRFEDWKKLVNDEVVKRVIVGCDDIPDVDYMGLYEAGNTPVEAAEFALDESGQSWREACSDSTSPPS